MAGGARVLPDDPEEPAKYPGEKGALTFPPGQMEPTKASVCPSFAAPLVSAKT